MELFSALLLAGMLIAMVAGLKEFVIPRALATLGGKDEWWSPVRIKPPAGQYAIMSRMRSNGPFALIIHSVRDHHLDEDNDFIKGKNPENPSSFGEYLDALGLVWVGFFKKYMIKPTEYTAIDKVKDQAKYDIVEKKRNKDASDPYYFFQYSTMAAHIEAAETKGNLPVDMDILFTARHRNPYKVHFLAGKWTVRAVAAVEKGAKEFVRDKDFNQLREEHAKGAGGLVDTLKHLGDVYDANGNLVSTPDEADGGTNPRSSNLTTKYGLEIDDPEFVKFDLTPGDPRVKKALEEAEVQRQLKFAMEERNNKLITRAQGDMTVELINANRDREASVIRAEGVTAIARAWMSVPQGAELAMAEAVRETKPRFLVLGNTPVALPLPVRTEPQPSSEKPVDKQTGAA